MLSRPRSRKRPLMDGYMCFSLDGTSKTQKSAYNPKRRAQVHEVRKVGACLRCQLLKKSCSKGNPCDTCVRAAAKSSASRSLSWMECIRPTLCNLTIYGPNALRGSEVRLGGIPVLQYLGTGDVDLKFDIPFRWNIDELTAFIAGWLINDHDAPRASMVGIMSSAGLLSVVSDLAGTELAQVLKALVNTSSLIFNSSDVFLMLSEYSADIRTLQHCGHRLLQHLDTQMRPATLARLRKHELYILFLLLLGCLISSKYVSESLGDLSQLEVLSKQTKPHRQKKTSSASSIVTDHGHELVNLLSHQLVYVGQATGILLDGAESGLISDLTSKSWRKQASSTCHGRGEAREYGLQMHDIVEAPEVEDSTSRTTFAAEPKSGDPIWQYDSPGISLREFRPNTYRHTCQCDPVPASTALRYLAEARNQCACEVHITKFRPTKYTDLCFREEQASIITPSNRQADVSVLAQSDDQPQHAWHGASQSLIDRQNLSRGYTICTFCQEEFRTASNVVHQASLEVLQFSDACTVCTALLPNSGMEQSYDFDLQMSWATDLPEVQQSHIQQFISNVSEIHSPASPLDLSIATFDPDVPTSGMEPHFTRADVGEQWAFLSRVPSPSPADTIGEAEAQVWDISNQHQQQTTRLQMSAFLCGLDEIGANDVLSGPRHGMSRGRVLV